MKLLNSLLGLLQFNRRNWRAISLCILAATIFWVFNALNKNYTTTISFPVQFDYDSRHYIPVAPLQDELRINVSGMGWDIFRRTIGLREQPLTIPLERPSAVKKIVGSTLPALFSSQIEALHINFIVNDTVYIDFQPRRRRWITLSADSVQRFIHPEFGIVGSVAITPDSIRLDGPLNMITSIKEPFPLNLNVSQVDENYNEEVQVIFPNDDFITKIPSQVSVSFSVERFVEVTDTVKLELTNIPKDANPKMDIARLPATIRLQQSKAESLEWDSLKAVVDLKSFNKGVIKVRPEIHGLPLYAELIKIDTIRIVY